MSICTPRSRHLASVRAILGMVEQDHQRHFDDRLLALGAEKQRRPAEPQRWEGIRSRTRTFDDAGTSSVSGNIDGQSKIDDPRRPLQEDEYSSISPTAWSRTSHVQREIFSYIGRINETSEGEQAPGDDWQIYKEETQSGQVQ